MLLLIRVVQLLLSVEVGAEDRAAGSRVSRVRHWRHLQLQLLRQLQQPLPPPLRILELPRLQVSAVLGSIRCLLHGLLAVRRCLATGWHCDLAAPCTICHTTVLLAQHALISATMWGWVPVDGGWA